MLSTRTREGRGQVGKIAAWESTGADWLGSGEFWNDAAGVGWQFHGGSETLKGILGKKVGMTQVFDEQDAAVPVTVIEAGPCWVIQVKTPEQDGYSAVQLGFEKVKPARLTRGQLGHLGQLKKSEQHPQRRVLADVPPLRYLREFRVKVGDLPQEGEQITAAVFDVGDRVDVVGTAKGRGFAGGIKRHNFKRQPKTHGQSDRHRAPGSAGATTGTARVFKGKRMPGRMGGHRVTSQNLEVVLVDPERNLLAVRGPVPGPRNGLVVIKPARKQKASRGGDEDDRSRS
ncbi:MAG: 50S ribosomal protein L3 [Anaerolineae bacterium]|nr:50S ribosomal protein L3 [Anaerolineae bacterium]